MHLCIHPCDLYPLARDVEESRFTQDLMLLGGCTLGNGDNLQSLKLSHNSKIKPMAKFTGNKQIVRCSWHNPDTGALFTAGEASILSVWKPSVVEELKSTVKPMRKDRKRKSTRSEERRVGKECRSRWSPYH